MATVKDLRAFVLSLPGTTEGTHFRLPAFRVEEKPFIGVEKDNEHVLFRLDKEHVLTLVGKDPATFEEVWQSKKYLIGIRLALSSISSEKLIEIVELSWRTKAPKKLILSYDKSKQSSI